MDALRKLAEAGVEIMLGRGPLAGLQAGPGASQEPRAPQARACQLLLDNRQGGPGLTGIEEGVDPGVAQDDAVGGGVAVLQDLGGFGLASQSGEDLGMQQVPIDIGTGSKLEGLLTGGKGGVGLTGLHLEAGQDDEPGRA